MTDKDDLQRCTVRLNVASSQGTGFFVAPNWILTCAHVVESVKDNLVQVFWKAGNQNYTAKVTQLYKYPIDLALLKLEGDCLHHPCIELDSTEPNLNDDLYIFGYPKNSEVDYSLGDSASFKYEGISFKEDIILYKLKQGQVISGFSGSPLLNLLTGKVCGVVHLSRDESNDLGGRAVSAQVIVQQFPEVALLNEQFHQQKSKGDNPFEYGLPVPPQGFYRRKKEIFDKLGVRQQYLEAIVTQERFCRWADERYIDETARPLLMNIAPYDLHQLEGKVGIKRNLIEVVEEQIARGEQILILGDPGSGKTTALERLTYIYALRGLEDTSTLLPVLIPLNRYDGNLIQIFRAAFNEVVRLELSEEEIVTLLKNMEALILLDGLNELGEQRGKGVLEVRNFMAAHPRYFYALTCRTQGYHNDLEFKEAWEVQPVEERDLERYLHSNLGDQGKELYSQIRRDERLLGLASNPLVLSMILETGEVPQNRGELYRNFVKKMLWREGQKGERSHFIPGEVKMRVLAWLGYKMQQDQILSCQERYIKNIFVNYIQDWSETYNWRELLEEIKLNGLLHLTRNRWTFTHQSFQEFFAAYKLEEDGLPDDVFEQVITNPEWNEVIFFLSGITEQGSKLVKRLLSRDPFLAVNSIIQGASPNEKVLQLVIDKIGEISYCENWAIQRTCADLMGEIRSPLAHNYLFRLLKDNNSEVRWGAVYALQRIGVREGASQALIPMLNDSFWVTQGTAAIALGILGAIEAVPPIGKLLNSHHPYIRASATSALIKLSFTESTPGSQELLNSSLERVRTLANFAAQVVDSPLQVVFIRDSLNSGTTLVKEAAINILVHLKEFQAAPQIATLLEDKVPTLRGFAVWALGKLQAREFSTKVIDLMLTDSEQFVRTSAAAALDWMSAYTAFPYFLVAAKDEDPKVRLVVARSLGRMRLHDAVPLLQELAENDPDSNVRSNAVQALGYIAKPESLKFLEHILKEEKESEVKQTIQQAIDNITWRRGNIRWS